VFATIALVVAMFAIPAVIALLVIRPGTPPQSGPTTAALARPATTGPGIEPTTEGEWPSGWARFEGGDASKRLTGLSGLGFSFDVPSSWECRSVGDTITVRYQCGSGFGTPDEIGGDVIVRTCPESLCTGDRRAAMRKVEEAWGQQWHRAGNVFCWTETTAFDGPPHYGLVVVGYWRSVNDGVLDRQIVVRFTAPADKAAEIQKVANSVRMEVLYGAP
jgi:hypothetical protein